MLFYIMIIIIILIIVFLPKPKPNNKVQEHYKVFDINRDVLSKTNDIAKYLLLDQI